MWQKLSVKDKLKHLSELCPKMDFIWDGKLWSCEALYGSHSIYTDGYETFELVADDLHEQLKIVIAKKYQ